MIQFKIHCFAVLWFRLDVLISRIEPCQTTLAKGHCKKRWVMVSSSSSHIRHLLDVGIPLLLRFAKTGRLSCKVFQMKVRIFKGSLTFQINKHQRDSVLKWACVAWITKPNYSSKPNTSSIRKPNSTRIIIPSTSRPIYIYILGLWYLASSEN